MLIVYQAQTAAGQFATTAEEEEAEHLRRRDFSGRCLNALKTELKILTQTYHVSTNAFTPCLSHV